MLKTLTGLYNARLNKVGNENSGRYPRGSKGNESESVSSPPKDSGKSTEQMIADSKKVSERAREYLAGTAGRGGKVKYEIKVHNNWSEVTPDIFHSWAGERQLGGKPYKGEVHYLGTKEKAKGYNPL